MKQVTYLLILRVLITQFIRAFWHGSVMAWSSRWCRHSPPPCEKWMDIVMKQSERESKISFLQKTLTTTCFLLFLYIWLQKPHKPVRAGKVTSFMGRCIIMGDNGNLHKFGAPYRHGTVFPPKQSAFQKEAMGMVLFLLNTSVHTWKMHILSYRWYPSYGHPLLSCQLLYMPQTSLKRKVLATDLIIPISIVYQHPQKKGTMNY